MLGGVFSLLLCLSCCSLLTVLSLASLYSLAGVLGVRLFTFLMIKTGRASHGYDPLGKVKTDCPHFLVVQLTLSCLDELVLFCL